MGTDAKTNDLLLALKKKSKHTDLGSIYSITVKRNDLAIKYLKTIFDAYQKHSNPIHSTEWLKNEEKITYHYSVSQNC